MISTESRSVKPNLCPMKSKRVDVVRRARRRIAHALGRVFHMPGICARGRTHGPDRTRSVVRAVAIFERVGVRSAEDAREWRRATLDRHGLPVAGGEA